MVKKVHAVCQLIVLMQRFPTFSLGAPPACFPNDGEPSQDQHGKKWMHIVQILASTFII